MTISIRLGEKLETKLRKHLSSEEESLSDFVRKAVEDRLERVSAKKSPYQLGKDLFGKYSSGRGDLSRRSKEVFREKMRARHAKRSA
jgi:RHH-type transcriptional regulator, rel operon repressor / antitoxin RelB